jgi:hypothetical protein
MEVRPRLRLRAGSVVLVGVGMWLGAAKAWGAQATLVADAHVNSAVPAANSGAISNLDVGGGYTTLLQFDLSQLPAGTTAAQVSRAVLRLYANRVTAPGQVTFSPVTGAWGEYSVTYASEPSVGSVAGAFSVSQAGAFVAVDVTSLVQGWITSPATNNGIALSASTAAVQFDSKENDLTAHAATLDVNLVNSGPQGAAGATGAQGAAGPIGPAGPMGLTGVTGATGAVGPAGTQGLTGATGAAGTMGLQGLTGPAGATGPAGPQGPAGTSGSGGLVYQGNYSSTQNYAQGDIVVWQGSSYTSLIASNHGNTPSLSPLQWGVLSAQGPAGPQGVTGAAGAAGPQGLPGTMGANGPPGPQGLQGIAGQAGAQGIPGATGATGLSGPMGPQGVPGPVGITFQGAYSSTTNYALADGVSYKGSGYVSLVASNHGNTPDQSPQQWAQFAAAGAAGATGQSGATGATGSTGPTGLQGVPGPTGATGATGPQGPPVANYLGNYQSSRNYARNDAVSWQGSTYVSLIASNLGNTPDQSPQQWAVLAAQGIPGVNGAAGPVGPVGPAGLAGATGATGPQGPPVTFQGEWLIGTTYAIGDAVGYGGSSYIAVLANVGREPDMSPQYWGLMAAAGAAGPAGLQGLQGLQGPNGYAGQAGATGPQGPVGPAGQAGPAGTPGATGPQGPAGPIGATGATGANGIPGTNGSNGTDGAPGLPGMSFKGVWLSGYGYAVNDAVTYGSPASTYIALSSNASQDPVDNPGVWTLLAPAGSAGPSGPSGPVPALTVGTVTTGAAGTLAAVTITGTSSAPALNFTIPQGAAGQSGSGSGGGAGTSGIPFASVYHVQPSGGLIGITPEYYSVNNYAASSTESPSLLTWVPAGCVVSALNVYSQLTAQTTLTLRALATPTSLATTLLTCTVAAGPGATTCSVPDGTQVDAGAFLDYSIISQNGPSSPGIWTALACN